MALHLIEAPAGLPVSMAMVRDHLRIGSDEDALVELYVSGAVAEVERQTRRQLATARWRLLLDRSPCGRTLELPRPPLQSVEAVRYVPPGGDPASPVTIDPSLYDVDTASLVGRVVLRSGEAWPAIDDRPGSLMVEFTAGFGDAVPKDLQAALLLIIGHRYANREDVITGTISTAIPLASQAILAGYPPGGIP